MEKLGTVLAGMQHQKATSTAKQLPLDKPKCCQCKAQPLHNAATGLCLRCGRAAKLAQLAPAEYEAELCKIIPPLYFNARVASLNKQLVERMNCPNNYTCVLWGVAGVGKTYATSALAQDFWAKGFTVERCKWDMLLWRIKGTYQPAATESEVGVLRPLLVCDKLFIEDIGVSVGGGKVESDFANRTLLMLLDERLEQMRPTYFTTNKSVQDLGESFDQRVLSRLAMGTCIHLDGTDRRQTKNGKGWPASGTGTGK